MNRETMTIKDGVLIRYIGEDRILKIPQGVKKIGAEAFRRNQTLSIVILPSSVKSINSFAFAECSKLRGVICQNGLEGIGRGAFAFCERLRAVRLPDSLDIIGPYAFYADFCLEDVIISPYTFLCDDGEYSPFSYTPWYETRKTKEEAYEKIQI